MMQNANVTFILGGARSGKSRQGEQFAAQSGLKKIYVATSQIFDDEMKDRIALHREGRGIDWSTVEEPLDLVGVLQEHCSLENILLIDCLTLWLTNLMLADKNIEDAGDQLCAQLLKSTGPVILVSNEVGQGIVPENQMARAFRDHAGSLHQKIAAISGQVYFVTAGLAQKLK
jgi:adenosylcobinamide kinase/adenosylcobinamide-phosphate guanylyltransferase